MPAYIAFCSLWVVIGKIFLHNAEIAISDGMIPEAMSHRMQKTDLSLAKLIVIVVPAHNEAAAIGQVIFRIPKQINGMRALPIVVDDGSNDGTCNIARAYGAYVLRHVTNLGAGAATLTGLRAAQALGADIIVTMDADGQHNPDEIEKLVQQQDSRSPWNARDPVHGEPAAECTDVRRVRENRFGLSVGVQSVLESRGGWPGPAIMRL